MKNKNKGNLILAIAVILGVLGIFIILFFAFNKSFNKGGEFDSELASRYGELISGVVGSIFTLVGFLLLYLNINDQRYQFQIQQVESSLFMLIGFHRDNVEKMNFTSPYSKIETLTEGRNVVIDLKKQCVDLYNDCKKELSGYEQEKIIEISYIIFFFGISEKTLELTKQQLFDNKLMLNKDEINKLIIKLKEKKTKYNDKIVFYGGHHSKLGNYFRHIYRTVKFIDDNMFITDDEKKKYLKLLRSQFTTYEQALLFLNSISPLGRRWKDLIEKYEMIKNIPPQFLDDIEVKKYYPKIIYEFDVE